MCNERDVSAQHACPQLLSRGIVPIRRLGCCSCNGRATLVEACAQHVTDAHDPSNCTAEVLQVHEQATHVKTASKKLHSLSSMSNSATAAELQHSGICQTSISNHALLVCPRFLAYAASPSVWVLAQHIYVWVINSGHKNTVAYSGCSASLSKRQRFAPHTPQKHSARLVSTRSARNFRYN